MDKYFAFNNHGFSNALLQHNVIYIS